MSIDKITFEEYRNIGGTLDKTSFLSINNNETSKNNIELSKKILRTTIFKSKVAIDINEKDIVTASKIIDYHIESYRNRINNNDYNDFHLLLETYAFQGKNTSIIDDKTKLDFV